MGEFNESVSGFLGGGGCSRGGGVTGEPSGFLGKIGELQGRLGKIREPPPLGPPHFNVQEVHVSMHFLAIDLDLET